MQQSEILLSTREPVRVLVVDDEENIQKILKLIFKKSGYDIDTVGSGIEAIAKVESQSYNVVLLDIKLPDMEGIELISHVKNVQPESVVMMMTAFASQETAIQALNKGASAYILKPFNMQEVLLKVKEIVEKQGLEADRRRLQVELERELEERIQAEEALAQARDNLALKVEERTRDLVEEKKRIETIVETLPEGILFIDSERNLHFSNKVFKNYYNRIRGTSLPTTLNEFKIFGNSFGDNVSKLFYSDENQSVTIEPIKSLHLQLTSRKVIIPPDQFLGVIITVSDVSPFVELDNLRKQFVSVVSHELRTPITAIDLSIQNLQRFKDKLSEAQTNDIIEMISNSSSVLNQMIEDLLIVSRIEARRFKLNFKTFKLNKIMQEVINQLTPTYRAKNVKLICETSLDIELFGDPKRIGQIIRILVDNACKYSAEKSTVKIESHDNYFGKYNPQNMKGLLIQVSDNGIGISEKDLPHLFQRFFRGSNTKDTEGTGIGLVIAKELTSLHKGEIIVDSEIGKGSIFSVFLPCFEESDLDKSELKEILS